MVPGLLLDFFDPKLNAFSSGMVVAMLQPRWSLQQVASVPRVVLLAQAHLGNICLHGVKASVTGCFPFLHPPSLEGR